MRNTRCRKRVKTEGWSQRGNLYEKRRFVAGDARRVAGRYNDLYNGLAPRLTREHHPNSCSAQPPDSYARATRRLYAAYNRRDWDAYFADTDPEFEWDPTEQGGKGLSFSVHLLLPPGQRRLLPKHGQCARLRNSVHNVLALPRRICRGSGNRTTAALDEKQQSAREAALPCRDSQPMPQRFHTTTPA
jgi:hypothetical protein